MLTCRRSLLRLHKKDRALHASLSASAHGKLRLHKKDRALHASLSASAPCARWRFLFSVRLPPRCMQYQAARKARGA
jgi:hypothetical protein